MSGKRIVGACVSVALIASTAGCTAMHRIDRIDAPTPPRALARIEVGDLVTLVMKDGRKASFEVGSIRPDLLVSVTGEQFPRAEMASLEHDRLDLERSLVLSGVIAAGVYVFGLFLGAIGFGGQ